MVPLLDSSDGRRRRDPTPEGLGRIVSAGHGDVPLSRPRANDFDRSRLPDPEWLEHWLDKQIEFNAVWETKVVERILHNLSLLMDRSFKSVQELNRFRKEITATLAAGNSGAAPNAA